MKFSYPEIDGYFDFGTEKVNTVVLENPDFFRRFLEDIHGQINGNDGKSVLSLKDVPVEMSRYAEILDTFVPFEINRKNLLTKITSSLEKAAVEPAHYEDSMKFLRETELYLEKLAFEFPCDIIFSKITTDSIIKSVSPVIRDEYENLCEKILDYFELVREFDKDKLFILVNLRSVINDDDFEMFLKGIISRKYSVLMIENTEKSKSDFEKRVVIDNDLCEIY